MQITLTGKHIDITDAIRSYAEEKCAKLPRYFDLISQIEVIIDGNADGGHKMVEIITSADHYNDIIAKETGDDVYACIDIAVDKIERQLTKQKEKQRNHKHTPSAQGMPIEEPESE